MSASGKGECLGSARLWLHKAREKRPVTGPACGPPGQDEARGGPGTVLLGAKDFGHPTVRCREGWTSSAWGVSGGAGRRASRPHPHGCSSPDVPETTRYRARPGPLGQGSQHLSLQPGGKHVASHPQTDANRQTMYFINTL